MRSERPPVGHPTGEVLYLDGYLQVDRGLGLTHASFMNLPIAAGMVVARSIVAVLPEFTYSLTTAGCTVLILFGRMDAHPNLAWAGSCSTSAWAAAWARTPVG